MNVHLNALTENCPTSLCVNKCEGGCCEVTVNLSTAYFTLSMIEVIDRSVLISVILGILSKH